jgi:hypothetical protein
MPLSKACSVSASTPGLVAISLQICPAHWRTGGAKSYFDNLRLERRVSPMELKLPTIDKMLVNFCQIATKELKSQKTFREIILKVGAENYISTKLATF